MKKSILFAVSILLATHLSSQKTKNIDQIFGDWNNKNHPGGVVYISKAGKVLYSKSFGLSNVQYSIPNTIKSSFNLASVSKQFTALGIALLHEEGKLSIDSSIKTYLPELANFGHKITIRHLLHHTSGLRSTPELFLLAGWREGDGISTEDVFSYMCKQKDLNFEPGSEYMYSNTNYVLLAMIINRVSHQNFSDWMNTNVFESLGMTNTYIDESNLHWTVNTCTPYIEDEKKQFIIAKNSSLDIGASNVYSSAQDLMKWLNQVMNPDKKWEKAIELMLTNDTLTNGTINEYAFGLIKDEYKGHKRIYHNGGIPGHLSFTMSFPNEKLSVIILSNYLDFRANQRVEMLLSVLLDEKSNKESIIESVKHVPLNLKNAQNYVSDYWNINENYSRSIVLENDTLWYLRPKGSKSPLKQIEDSVFILGGIKTIVRIQFYTKDSKLYMKVKDGKKAEQIFESYKNSPPSSIELNSYTGIYYSPELETSYTITKNNEGLTGYHSRHGYFPIEVLRKGMVSWSGLAVAKYKLNDEGKVIGFYVTMDRVRNIWFIKQ